MRHRLLPILAALTAIGGCASVEELADASCRSWGAQPGTTAYVSCMSEQVAAIEAGNLAATTGIVSNIPQPPPYAPPPPMYRPTPLPPVSGWR